MQRRNFLKLLGGIGVIGIMPTAKGKAYIPNDPHKWIDDNYTWLKDWLCKPMPLSDPIFKWWDARGIHTNCSQVFRSHTTVDDHHKMILLHLVFGKKLIKVDDYRQTRLTSGFVEQMGRMPTELDRPIVRQLGFSQEFFEYGSDTGIFHTECGLEVHQKYRRA